MSRATKLWVNFDGLGSLRLDFDGLVGEGTDFIPNLSLDVVGGSRRPPFLTRFAIGGTVVGFETIKRHGLCEFVESFNSITLCTERVKIARLRNITHQHVRLFVGDRLSHGCDNLTREIALPYRRDCVALPERLRCLTGEV